MIKFTGIFILAIALLIESNLCQPNIKQYSLEGTYTKGPDSLQLQGSIGQYSGDKDNIGSWTASTQNQDSQYKLLTVKGQTQDHQQLFTMYGAYKDGANIFASAINEKFQKIGGGLIVLYKGGTTKGIVIVNQQNAQPLYKIDLDKVKKKVSHHHLTGKFYIDFTDHQYELGTVEITQVYTNHYRGVIKHSKQGYCQQEFEFCHDGGPGVSQFSVPFSFACDDSSDYAYDMIITKIFEDDNKLQYGIQMEPSDYNDDDDDSDSS